MGLLSWLRRFFYSDDEVVKLVGALTEPEAELRRELLANEAIVSMVKNMSGIGYRWGGTPSSFDNTFDLFVKQSDLARATEVLGAFDLARSGDAPEQGSWHTGDRA